MISFKNFLKENIKTNTFTHEDHEYDLTALNKIIIDNKIEDFKVSDLDWIFEFDNPLMDTPERILKADIKVPIIVTKDKKKLVVLDGLHRLAKAKIKKLKTLPGRMVSSEQLKQAKI